MGGFWPFGWKRDARAAAYGRTPAARVPCRCVRPSVAPAFPRLEPFGDLTNRLAGLGAESDCGAFRWAGSSRPDGIREAEEFLYHSQKGKKGRSPSFQYTAAVAAWPFSSSVVGVDHRIGRTEFPIHLHGGDVDHGRLSLDDERAGGRATTSANRHQGIPWSSATH